VIVGGMITGPVYGLLGQRWRVRREWASVLPILPGAESRCPQAVS